MKLNPDKIKSVKMIYFRTMTISAKAAGTSNSKVQFNVRRITVEEKIIRVNCITSSKQSL